MAESRVEHSHGKEGGEVVAGGDQGTEAPADEETSPREALGPRLLPPGGSCAEEGQHGCP